MPRLREGSVREQTRHQRAHNVRIRVCDTTTLLLAVFGDGLAECAEKSFLYLNYLFEERRGDVRPGGAEEEVDGAAEVSLWGLVSCSCSGDGSCAPRCDELGFVRWGFLLASDWFWLCGFLRWSGR